MVVDDNQGILDVMRRMLERAGYAVTTTAEGGDLRNLKVPFPDLVFLDLLLSGEDGSELCRTLKKQPRAKRIPVIILSANTDAEKIAKACGADGFLAKPFQMMDMLALVERYIAQ